MRPVKSIDIFFSFFCFARCRVCPCADPCNGGMKTVQQRQLRLTSTRQQIMLAHCNEPSQLTVDGRMC